MNREICAVHWVVFWVCTAITVLVFSMMLYTLIKQRNSAVYQSKKFHSSLAVEVVWAIIPFLILIAMSIPAVGGMMRMNDCAKRVITETKAMSTVSPINSVSSVSAKNSHY